MKKVLVIVGPTGVGKTGLALELAQKYDGQLISADSRQVYKDLDVGTGKEVELLQPKQGETLTQEAQKHSGYWLINNIKVNLYDCCELNERFTAADFKSRAERVINEIHREGKLPIVVGGTGLYVSSLVENFQFPPDNPDSPLRERLNELTIEKLRGELEEVDPMSLAHLDQSNPLRLRRALEVFYTTNNSIQTQQIKGMPQWDFLNIGLTKDRETLYHKVDAQVEDWLNLGLITETEKALKEFPTAAVLKGIHYKQVLAYLHGDLTKTEMIQKIKFERHAYIRRQYTWFNKMKGLAWFDVPQDQATLRAHIDTWLHN